MCGVKGGNIERFNLCDNIICNSNKNKLCDENVSLIETIYKQQQELVTGKVPVGGIEAMFGFYR